MSKAVRANDNPLRPPSRPLLAALLCLASTSCHTHPAHHSAAPHAEPANRPNIVIIFADDQGYEDVGCYGATEFETPHLDTLARQGMRFTDFYVAEPVCSASRAALLTGCYAKRLSIRGALGPNAKIGLNRGELTIAEMLKTRGYATGAVGKWHLGHRPPFLPLQHGFDDYLGIPYSNDMWPVYYDGAPVTPDSPQNRRWLLNYPPLPLIDGNDVVQTINTLEDQSTLTTRYTQRAVQFIDEHHEQPFFLYLAHSMPHVPLGVSSKFDGASRQGMYGDVISEIDWSVGQVISALDRHGLADNTIVIYTSDNGPWLNFGNHAGSVGPLREGKGATWDGGVRVPCIMRWPGHIPANTTNHLLASTLDILPTLAAIVQTPLPEHKIDGVNILPILLDAHAHRSPRDHIVFYYSNQPECIRQGKWKLHVPHGYRSYQGVQPGKDGFPGPYARGQTGIELYDLSTDIGETNNIADAHPEVVNQMLALVEHYRETLGHLDQSPGTEVRPPGRIE